MRPSKGSPRQMRSAFREPLDVRRRRMVGALALAAVALASAAAGAGAAWVGSPEATVAGLPATTAVAGEPVGATSDEDAAGQEADSAAAGVPATGGETSPAADPQGPEGEAAASDASTEDIDPAPAQEAGEVEIDPETGEAQTGGDEPTTEGAGSAASGSCRHKWVARTKTVHHKAKRKAVTTPATYKTVTAEGTACNGCGKTFASVGAARAHCEESGHAGYTEGVRITQRVLETPARSERVVVRAAYDEKATTYTCSKCGKRKGAR